MCDTILALPRTSVNDSMLFGKNSDRQRNEAQTVEFFPSATHERDARVRCTYLEIPQAGYTHAVLLCRPFWIWGAEMGANEKGVVIGNQGLHARVAAPEEESLTGMDLLRLALERASSAVEAVRTITELLEQYGQGGNCGHLTPAYYQNGFMIADADDGFVLETVGREWILERVDGVRSISNIYSIGREAQATSAGLSRLVQAWTSEPAPDYAAVIANPHREHIGNAGARRACSTSLLKSRSPSLTISDMMNILRDHGSGEGFHSEWAEDSMQRRTICMHAGNEDRAGQTVGSMVSEVHRDTGVHWVTGTSAPCISVFKPVLLDVPLPEHGPRPTDRFDRRTLWWRNEQLYREALLGDFAEVLQMIRPERDELEAHFRSQIEKVRKGGNREERAHEVAVCWKQAMEAQDRWYGQLQSMKATRADSAAAAWIHMSEMAGLTFREREA